MIPSHRFGPPVRHPRPYTRTHAGPEIPDYEAYDYEKEWAGRGIEDEAERKLMARMATRAEYCLELGGGFGRITRVLERRFRRVYMVDYSVRNLEKAALRTRDAVLVRHDIRRLPFGDDSFDCVVAVRVLHHIADIAGMMDEMVRVGRRGGEVILGVPSPGFGRFKGTDPETRLPPGGHAIHTHAAASYARPGLRLEERRWLGLFDNGLGRRLDRLRSLSALDVATSRLWPLKQELFVKFRFSKEGGRAVPAVRCTCGGEIEGFRCGACSRTFGRVIDLVA
ncbi:MAG: class I SAM-dependent methyltransferase [Nitrososphaerota archaeon]|nr:class I SAM-dependent methyltransferase [Nitrososphaerota archaeon]